MSQKAGLLGAVNARRLGGEINLQMEGAMRKPEADQTITDFGDQWTRYIENEGYYGSVELFADILGPHVDPHMFSGKRVLDIGSGTGRIANMLIRAGASKVVAVEPSQAFSVLRENVSSYGDRVQCLNARGDELPEDLRVDHAVSIGVLHHIPDPAPVVRAVFGALDPGGVFAVWLYGYEGNEKYLAFTRPLRGVTTRLPHFLLSGVCHALNTVLGMYIPVAVRFRLPMHEYLKEVVAHLDRKARYLVIYDQLNPAYAKYYCHAEAEALLSQAGFVGIKSHHRHGYSWTVSGVKPGK